MLNYQQAQALEQLQLLLDFISNPKEYQDYLRDLSDNLSEMKQLVEAHTSVSNALNFQAQAAQTLADAKDKAQQYMQDVQKQLDAQTAKMDAREAELDAKDAAIADREVAVKAAESDVEVRSGAQDEKQKELDVQSARLADLQTRVDARAAEVEDKLAKLKAI